MVARWVEARSQCCLSSRMEHRVAKSTLFLPSRPLVVAARAPKSRFPLSVASLSLPPLDALALRGSLSSAFPSNRAVCCARCAPQPAPCATILRSFSFSPALIWRKSRAGWPADLPLSCVVRTDFECATRVGPLSRRVSVGPHAQTFEPPVGESPSERPPLFLLGAASATTATADSTSTDELEQVTSQS